MAIDWVTVVAQIVNFLVLVYLLKRFLYRPVLNAMARREQRIADRLDQAAEREEKAAAQRQRYEDKAAELERQREHRLHEAESEAESRREELLEAAREEAESMREQWHRAARQEYQSLQRELRQHAADALADALRQALSDLADAHLEAQMVEALDRRLAGLDEAERARLAEALRRADPPRVRSRFELEEPQRARLRDTLRRLAGQAVEPAYERSQDLVCGIELVGKDRRLSWSVSEYLRDLEGDFGERLAASAVTRHAEAG